MKNLAAKNAKHACDDTPSSLQPDHSALTRAHHKTKAYPVGVSV